MPWLPNCHCFLSCFSDSKAAPETLTCQILQHFLTEPVAHVGFCSSPNFFSLQVYTASLFLFAFALFFSVLLQMKKLSSGEVKGFVENHATSESAHGSVCVRRCVCAVGGVE